MITTRTDKKTFYRLGDLIECLDSKRIPLSEEERRTRQGTVPYYGANGQVGWIDDHLFDERLLLLAEDGGSWASREKCAYIIEGKSWVNNHAHVLQTNGKIDLDYLCYYLNHSDLSQYITGTTRGKLNQGRMNDIQVLTPPLDSQKRIALLLKKTESALEKRCEAIRLLEDFLKSTFLEMFGDPIRNPKKYPVKNFRALTSEDPCYGAGASARPFVFGCPRYIRITDVDDKGNLNDEFVSADLSADEQEKYSLREGDVLFARSGATVGKAYRYRNADGPCVYAGYMIRFRFDPLEAHPDYIFFFTKTNAYQKWVEARKKVVAQPNINAKQYGWELKIPVAPLKDQLKFSKIVEQTQSLKQKMKSSETELQNLFAALMQKAFKGELTTAGNEKL